MAAGPEELIPTRDSLLSRIKDWQDSEGWQEFYQTYWKLIYATARKAGLGDAEAHDIVQETFISVARNIEGFKYDPAVCSFKRWMLQVTRWRIVNQFKRRQRQPQTPPESGCPDETNESTGLSQVDLDRIADPAGIDLETIWDQEWQKHVFDAALERTKRQVDAGQLQIFDLYCLQRWPAPKVAQTLGVSIGIVYLIKHRVGRVLKREIQALQRELG